MKIKYVGTNPDADRSIDLVDTIKSAGIITDPDNQILGIYPDRIELEGIMPCQALSDIMVGFPDYRIFTGPDEVDAFKPEPGLSDVDKIGTVPDPNYKESEPPINDNLDIELFPESELSEVSVVDESGNTNKINTFDKTMKKIKKFNDPTLDPNGVAVDAKQPEVEQEQAEDKADFTPAEGSFSSFEGVSAFSDEEIEKANDVQVDVTPEGEVQVRTAGSDPTPCPEGIDKSNDLDVDVDENGDITIFSDEEILDVTDNPDDLEDAIDETQEQLDTFSAHKRELHSAKRRLNRIRKKFADRKSFTDELSETEKSDVIDDIVAILKDSPEIKDAVTDEVSLGVVSTESEEPMDDVKPEDKPTEENTEEPTEEEDDEPTAFTDDEIESSEEETEVDPDTNLDSGEVTKIGEIFCKTFSDNNVMSYRRKILQEMANKQSNRR